jgi:hypothetical protein
MLLFIVLIVALLIMWWKVWNRRTGERAEKDQLLALGVLAALVLLAFVLGHW